MTAMPALMFGEICKTEICIKAEKIDPPLKIETAVYDGNYQPKFNASRKSKLRIMISTPVSKIPVRITDVDFYIVDQKLTEVLLGRPFLLQLGFYFDGHPRIISTNIEGKSMSEPCSRKMAYTAIKYHDEEIQSIFQNT